MSRSTIPVPRNLGGRTATAEELTQLRRMLEQQRDFRLDQLAQLRRLDRRKLVGPGGREIHDSLVAGARAALHEVLDALHRMDVGRYGACRECREPLELQRLEILPQVALCLHCQRAVAAAGS